MPVNYTVLTRPAARRQLQQLQKANNPRARDIVSRIVALAENPRPPGCRKLVNRPEWRIRVGDFRVLYSIDDLQQTVTVSAIAHRREVYRDD